MKDPHRTTSPRRRLLNRLGIESGEGRLVAWAGAVLALVGWADVSVQNASEVVFLKRVSVELLPVAFLASSLLLVITTYAVGRLVVGRDRLALLPRLFVLLAIGLIPLWYLTRSDFDAAFWAGILFSKQIEALSLLVFWIAVGDLLHGRQAKRLFGPLVAGFTLGTILGSFASEPIGRLLGVDGLLLFSAGVLGLTALVSMPLRSMRPARLERGLGRDTNAARVAAETAQRRSEERVSSIPELWRRSGLFRLLLISTLCSGLLGPMLYFQFQYVANLATEGAGAEQRLLSLYAWIRGWLNLAVLVTQLGVTSRLYRRIGVPLSAVLSPLIYVLGFLGLSVQLSLRAGVAAMAGARLQDHAIYDPAQRVLFNLFPETLRAQATALLAEPAKRLGSALGNVLVLAALALGTARLVGLAALPIAAVWLAAAVVLWRAYPNLLLQASARRGAFGEALSLDELLDATTLRVLSGRLRDPDPARCRAAIELVSEARPELAVAALAEAAREATDATRPLLVAALDRQLEGRITDPVHSEAAAAAVRSLLEESAALEDRDRADLVQAYGRLTAGHGEAEEQRAVLDRSLRDGSPAERLAAAAALYRRGVTQPSDVRLDTLLADAVGSRDPSARRTAREEYRALLLGSDPDPVWEERLGHLAELLEEPADRVEAVQAIVEVARRHGAAASVVASRVLALRDDPDEAVRAAVLRYVGLTGLEEEASWLVEHVGSPRRRLAAAAREGLLAAGPAAASALLVEHCFGRRSTRNAILQIVRELEVDRATLEDLYRRELDQIRQTLVSLYALGGHHTPTIVLQRLEERLDEGLHTALLFLTAIHDEDRIAELDDLMRRTQGQRQHAILLEALEAFLDPEEKEQLVPLFDDRSLEGKARIAARGLGIALPGYEQTARALLEDPDDLTRELALGTLERGAGVVATGSIGDDGGVLSAVEIALLVRTIPLFERLSTRQLMDLAQVAREETYASDAVIFRQGDDGSAMYFIVEGDVEIRQGEAVLNTLGARSFFGEMAVFEGETRSATVIAKSPTRLIRIERSDLLALIDEMPAIAVGILQSLSRRLRDADERM